MKPGKLLSGRIKELREAAGLSQQELATRADLSVSQVAKLEQGAKADPRLSTLFALAGALEISPGQILEGLPSKPAVPEKKAKKKAKKAKKTKSVARKPKSKKPRKKAALLVLAPSDNGSVAE